MHDNIMLKSCYDMKWLVLIHYKAGPGKQNFQTGVREPCMSENIFLALWVTWLTTRLWCHDDSGVTKSTQHMNANMCKWKISWWLGVDDRAIISNFVKDIFQVHILVCWESNNLMNICVVWWRWIKKCISKITSQFHYCDCKVFEWLNLGTI